ncbi:MAG: hypothetical protein DRI56_11250 [Chloroflexota bacterium]|nr:MAG: hypothetical protein DRI56_11250 [Chloroflexota bacterium]
MSRQEGPPSALSPKKIEAIRQQTLEHFEIPTLHEIAEAVNQRLTEYEQQLQAPLSPAERERIIHELCEAEEWHRLYDRLQLAHIDRMTGLPDHVGVEQRVHEALENGTPVAVALVDIDDLKKFNTAFSHAGGDRIIKAVVDTLKTWVEAHPGTIVGRWGGDEFVVVATGPAKEILSRNLDALCKKIAENGQPTLEQLLEEKQSKQVQRQEEQARIQEKIGKLLNLGNREAETAIEATIRKLHEMLEAEIRNGAIEPPDRITVSIGFAETTPKKPIIDKDKQESAAYALIAEASECAQWAKQTGKNRTYKYS